MADNKTNTPSTSALSSNALRPESFFYDDAENSGILSQDSKGKRNAFRGNFTHAIDDKGRVSLPSEFRKVIASKNDSIVMITNYITEGFRCLDGYCLSDWYILEDKIREKSRFDPQVQKFEMYYISRAMECPVDGSGRILLPQYLREYASIGKDLTFTSNVRSFKVWDKRAWDLAFQNLESSLIGDPAMFQSVDV
jgi:MraZ protein